MPKYEYDRKNWGRRLLAAAKTQGESTATLAEKLDMSESGLRSWLNGTRPLNLEDFFEVCEIAGMDPRLVLFDTVERSLEEFDLRRIREAYSESPEAKEALMTVIEGLHIRRKAVKKGKGFGKTSSGSTNAIRRRRNNDN